MWKESLKKAFYLARRAWQLNPLVLLLEKVYRIYSKTIPYLGKYLVGDSAPYDYLVKSIEDFYSQDELSGILRKNGFSEVEYRNLSGGIVAIHSGWKI